jgi:hypothetical protein
MFLPSLRNHAERVKSDRLTRSTLFIDLIDGSIETIDLRRDQLRQWICCGCRDQLRQLIYCGYRKQLRQLLYYVTKGRGLGRLRTDRCGLASMG